MFTGIFGKGRKDEGRKSEVQSYLGGAYRRHRQEDVERFTAMARDAFPEFAARITCFGADWLGRQFATDSSRMENGEPQVLMLEPGTGEAFRIPVGVSEFHERELVDYPNDVAAEPLFQDWLRSGGAVPGYDECVGYKVPLYLGGADELANLELSDFDVYWTISAQVLAKVRGLPDGTPINRVSISD